MPNKNEKISDSELEVLKILWLYNKPITERQIVDHLIKEIGWHRATIQTLIRRLYKKNIIQKEKKEVFHFYPLISEAEYANERTKELLNKVYGGNAKNLVSSLLSDNILSEYDIDDVKNFWSERRKNK